jgi:RimJ/RimL family protein N-acetyltransferase
MKVRLTGTRLNLVSLFPRLVSYCVWRNWLSDPVVNRYMVSGVESPSNESLRAYMKDGLLFGIYVPYSSWSLNDGWIGNVRLHQINKEQRTAELGIMIGVKEMWGRGFATEACTLFLDYAFGKMNLNRVGVGVVSENKAGVALWRKLGFVEEGRLREAFWVDGRPCDAIRMGLLQREWYGRKADR